MKINENQLKSIKIENVTRSIHGLAGRGTDGDLEQPAQLGDHPCHGPQVEQDGDHEVEEVDDGQHLEHEDEPHCLAGIDLLGNSLGCLIQSTRIEWLLGDQVAEHKP